MVIAMIGYLFHIQEIAKVQQREKERRLPKDTLLMATTTYEAEMEEV